ncbi:MAG TPA: hypothetical protein VFS29_05410, partial [Motilibacteraceae bacterium]|nr:hypothetical protein [Motilibacteraceae bacterium]
PTPPVRLGLSVGVAVGEATVLGAGEQQTEGGHPVTDQHAAEAAELVHRADAAMYADKARRREASGA